jgi:hypothetical protein
MRRYRPAEVALRKVTEKGDAFKERDFILQRGIGRLILRQCVEAGWIVAEPAALLELPMYRLTEHGRAGLNAATD